VTERQRDSAGRPIPETQEEIEAADRTHRALNKLAKWRSVFAGWQLGTRPSHDGETRAVRDHREATLLLRAEVSALVGVLIERGVMTELDWARALEIEARALDAAMAERFPGMVSTDDGISMNPTVAVTTMRALDFPA